MRILISKSNPKHRRGTLFGTIFGMVVFTSFLFYIPFENLFVTFDSPITAYNYYHVGDTAIDVRIDGENSSYVIDCESESKSTYFIIPKVEDGWKLPTLLNNQFVAFASSDKITADVIQYKNTKDYYVVIDTNVEGLSISDDYNTEFRSSIIYDNYGVITKILYYAYIPYFDSQYTITVNGNKLEFQTMPSF